MKKNVSIKPSVLDELIWMSYRYCIGRHTIASCMHADSIIDLIRDNKSVFNDQQINHFKTDIIDFINDDIKFCSDVEINGFSGDVYKAIVPFYNTDMTGKKLVVDYDGTVTIKECDKEKYSRSWKDEVPDLEPWHHLAMWLGGTSHIVTAGLKEDELKDYNCYLWYSYDGDERYSEVDTTNKNVWFNTPFIYNIKEV